MSTQQTAKTQYVTAGNGVTFAYRHLGHDTGIPLVMHVHFRANMDFWDPLLVNPLASKRPVILFDQAGVGRSNGNVATTYQAWADNVIALVEALQLPQIDLFGFSMGGYTVQMVALTAPRLLRKLIIAGSGPSVPKDPISGTVWPRDLPPEMPIRVLSSADQSRADMEDAITRSLFPPTDLGRHAANAYFGRIYARASRGMPDGDEPIYTLLSQERSREQRKAAAEFYVYNPRNSYNRLAELQMPVLILNGDDDLLIPSSQSWELLKGIEDAQLIIYPKAGHGFLWQYALRVASDINIFLDEDLCTMGPRL